MITKLSTYFLNIPICGILERDIQLPERITLFDSTHMMSMVDLIAISVETLRLDSGCSFGEIVQ